MIDGSQIRALHVIGGLDPEDGGPAYSVPRLCDALENSSVDTRIYTLAKGRSRDLGRIRFFSKSAVQVPLLRQLKLSSPLASELRISAAFFDVMHSHGLWLAPNVYAGKWAGAAKRPLVVSPRGMLSPGALQFSKWKKQLMWRIWQGSAYRNARVWHATSSAEAEDIRTFGIKAPIAIIPNGVDLPLTASFHGPKPELRTLLFLSRIHPKKGLPTLLNAWQALAPDRSRWRLVLAGPDENRHQSELEAFVKEREVPRVEFAGPVYGAEKEALLQTSDLFVLPTLSENFGIAVAEALSFGIPAIVSEGAPWQGLESERCGWWVGHGTEPLLAAMREATALPASGRRAMGKRGKAWMERDFGWEGIGQQMKSLYHWLTGRGPKPACVQLY